MKRAFNPAQRIAQINTPTLNSNGIPSANEFCARCRKHIYSRLCFFVLFVFATSSLAVAQVNSRGLIPSSAPFDVLAPSSSFRFHSDQSAGEESRPQLQQPKSINTSTTVKRQKLSSVRQENAALASSFQNEITTVEQILRQGNFAERPGENTKIDWNEALNYWEKALRSYPGDGRVTKRYYLAKIRYDIEHRLADDVYTALVGKMTLSQTRAALSEILNKIQINYVDSLDWGALSQCGFIGVKQAVSDSAFQSLYLKGVDSKEIDSRVNAWFENAATLVGAPEDLIRQAVIIASMAQRDFHINESVIMMEYLCGILNSLDPYTGLLPPTQLQDMFNQINGKFVGIGVELKPIKGRLRVLRTITGSPAEKAGLLSGDTILSVDGKKTADYSPEQSANQLQGEAGTTVRLEIARKNSPDKTVYIVRQSIESPSVEAVKIIDSSAKTGYIKINHFQKNTADELDAALMNLYNQGMRRLIIDLRGNPGGLLQAAVEVSNRFLSSGVVVSTRGVRTENTQVFSAGSEKTWNVPLVILIDNQSASAAEIFAGAMRDHRRAEIVGTQSYGKGSVQGIFPLKSCPMGLRLTTAKFYSPLGRGYTLTGVKPGIEIYRAARPAGEEELPLVSPDSDVCLKTGISAAARLTL